MNLLHADTKYADVLEHTLFNAGISGVSLTGDMFFYRNPMESNGKIKRKPWFEPGCCPSNVVRFLPNVGNYIYGTDDKGIFVNQFIGNEADIQINGKKIEVVQETNYSWEGKITITINPENKEHFRLNVRIPGWSKGKVLSGDLYSYVDDGGTGKDGIVLKVNGKLIRKPESIKGYAVIDRDWESGDIVELELPMPVMAVKAIPMIKDLNGQISLMRGPVVYCIEEIDNPGYFVENNEAYLFPDRFVSEYEPDLLGGVVTIKGKAALLTVEEEIDVTAIPYYSWCNRGAGQMKVWLPANLE